MKNQPIVFIIFFLILDIDFLLLILDIDLLLLMDIIMHYWNLDIRIMTYLFGSRYLDQFKDWSSFENIG